MVGLSFEETHTPMFEQLLDTVAKKVIVNFFTEYPIIAENWTVSVLKICSYNNLNSDYGTCKSGIGRLWIKINLIAACSTEALV